MQKMDKVNKFWSPLYDYANILALLFIAIGLFYSRALLSMGMIGLLLNAVLTFSTKQLWVDYKKDVIIYLMTFFFLIYLVSGFYSESFGAWFEIIKMKVPFLALPFVLLSNNARAKHVRVFIIVFCAILFYSTLPIIIEFISDIEGVLLKYQRGHTLKTPIGHVRYSLLLSVGVFVSTHFALKFYEDKKLLLSLGAVLFLTHLFLFTHLLAVRSGLVCMYVGLFVYSILYVIKNKYWRAFFIGIIIMLGFLFFAPKAFPTLENKIGYTMYGFGKLKNNEIGQYSDSKRLLSIKVGWELFKQNPIFGVGAGDLVPSVQDMYSQMYSDVAVESRLLPHNQFLRVVNSVGIIGLIAFLSFFIYPLFNKDIIRNPLLAAFIFSALASFCVEGTIENQIGTAYFIVFYFTFYKNTSFRLI